MIYALIQSEIEPQTLGRSVRNNAIFKTMCRAVQKLYVYMKKNAHVAVVAPGNYYGYERKRNEMYIEVGYSYRYQVL